MSAPSFRAEVPRAPNSDAPLALDLALALALADDTGSARIPVGWASGIPRSWRRMYGYLAAGAFTGLGLILTLALTREPSTLGAASAGVVKDNVVHLHARDIGESCWRGEGGSKDGSAAHVTVSIAIDADGRVRSAVAAGESLMMRGCVESLVKSWEFLPQAAPAQVVLPVEIDPR